MKNSASYGRHEPKLSATDRGQSPLNASKWSVYILSCSDGTYYTGCTSNLAQRLERHHKGWVPATKGRRPVNLVLQMVFEDKYKAFAFEKYLKTGSGRAFAKRHLVNPHTASQAIPRLLHQVKPLTRKAFLHGKTLIESPVLQGPNDLGALGGTAILQQGGYDKDTFLTSVN